MLTADSILVGLATVTLPNQVSAVFKTGHPFQMLTALVLFGLVAAAAFSVWRVFSVFFPKIEEREESVFYFGSIANLSRKEFENRMGAMDAAAIESELVHQTHINARIATQKFGALRASITWLGVSFGCALAFLVLKGLCC